MNDKQQRADFELIIGAFPYERSIERQPTDPSMAAFPGQYKDIDVQVAWEMYQAGYERGYEDSQPRHVHQNNPDSSVDDCLLCGQDLRNPVHSIGINMNDKVKANDNMEISEFISELMEADGDEAGDLVERLQLGKVNLIPLLKTKWISRKERLPTIEDSDCFNEIWVWDGFLGHVVLHHWSVVKEDKPYSYWMPTGLTKPSPPNEEETE